MTQPADLYLADLTHTGQIVASNVFPLGIGLLASYVLQRHPDLKVELFKYPEDLSLRLDAHIPPVVGFANYSWNLDLAYKYAARIKAVAPKTVIVFGGPNYGMAPEEIEEFWARHPLIDFYVVKEGEIAFLQLLDQLRAHGYDAEAVKRLAPAPANCHFRLDGTIVQAELLPRIKDLGEIGSPYLRGLMDKFFDGVLIPMIHTTRGCPFQCTFCTEGHAYYNKVSKRKDDLKAELEYIAERRGTVADMTVTDANFGMYGEDREKALIIADIQKRYRWPQRVIVSTGKNQKERIIEVASLLNGAMNIAASLQSTNDEVLKNIKRDNISREALRIIVDKATKTDSVTYTELILGLPGDSYPRHLESLREVTNAGLGIVRMYQLILLPQTELNTPDTRRQYGMKARFRVNPRSFGRYRVLGETLVAVEHEEILIEHDSMPLADYLACRELDLTIEVLHNAAMFMELSGLCRWLGYSWFDFLLRFHERRMQASPRLAQLYREYREDNLQGQFATKDELERHVTAHIDEYLANTEGTNEMAKAKAKGFFSLMEELHDLLYAEMKALVRELGRATPVLERYLDELKAFSLARKLEVIKTDKVSEGAYHFNFFAIQDENYEVDPAAHFHEHAVSYRFYHNPDQVNLIRGYIGQYGGETVDSLGRILMRATAKRLFRDFRTADGVYVNQAKQAQGLNVYGGFSVQ
jgi:radical SAM superfamily enzyme YgiQ (UPF0313 family)